MIHILRYSLLICCVSVSILCSAQISSGDQLANVIPNSPNTSAMMKFDNIPVSIYTGIPNISVPFYHISAGNVSIPVSLSYHAGGIKVGEEPSGAGLGWTLNIGGFISRTVRGTADESFRQGQGYFYHSFHDSVANFAKKYADPNVHHVLPMNNREVYFLQPFCLDNEVQKKDVLPDIFQFNFLGISGKFYFDKNKKIVLLQNSRIRITSNITPTTDLQSIRQFTVTDQSGNQYIFGMSKDNQRVGIERSAETGSFGTATTPEAEPADFTTPSASAWYLMDIITSTGRSIKFTYSSYVYSKEVKGVHTLTIEGLNQVNTSECDLIKLNLTRYFRDLRLQRIDFDNGNLQVDVNSTSRLYTGIKLFSIASATTPFRQMALNYSSSMLQSASISGNTTLLPQVYQFLYNSPMPASTLNPENNASNAQDWWGYYNGKTSNASLVPNTNYSYKVYECAGDRSVDPASAQVGTLRKIIYPTGGYSEFTYESNRAFISNNFAAYFPKIKIEQGKTLGKVWFKGQSLVDTIKIEYPDDVIEGGVKKAIVTYNEMSISPACVSDPDCYFGEVEVLIENLNGTLLKKIDTKTNTGTLLLPAGNYVVRYNMTNANIFTVDTRARSTITWKNFPIDSAQAIPDGEGYAGGLRIKKIVTADGQGNASSTNYVYNLFDDPQKTSGVLVNFFKSNVTSYVSGELDPSGYLSGFVYTYKVNSSGNSPLIATGGAPVGYRNVTVLYGDNGENGKEEYTYTSAAEYPDSNNINEAPYPYPCDYDDRRGLLLSKVTYKNVNKGVFIPVQANYSNYRFNVRPTVHLGMVVSNDLRMSPFFISLDSNYFPPAPAPNVAETFGPYFHIQAVRTSSEFVYKESDSAVTYDQIDLSKSMHSVTRYDYDTSGITPDDPYYQVIAVTTDDSKGDQKIIRNKYAKDFTGVYDEMNARNIVAPVVEQTEFKNSQQLMQVKNNYALFSNGLVLPESTDMKVGSATIEKRVQFLRYDSKGNLVEQQKSQDIPYTYIWDHTATYPTASVINADSSSVACTSFEGDAKGNWTFAGLPELNADAPTGKKVYNLSGGNLTKQLSSGSVYIISYWRPQSSSALSIAGTVTGYPKTGNNTVNGWKYFEHKVTGQSVATLSGSGLIDEIRLYPVNARVTTYTYEPLLGMSSACDENSHVLYYEYDDSGRLKCIRDQDKNIIKTFEYHYKQ
jgi:YD repeat-containing protein